MYWCLVTESYLTLCDPTNGRPPGCPWGFPGKNTGLGCHFLIQGDLPIQGLNPSLLLWECWVLTTLGHQWSLMNSWAYEANSGIQIEACPPLPNSTELHPTPPAVAGRPVPLSLAPLNSTPHLLCWQQVLNPWATREAVCVYRSTRGRATYIKFKSFKKISTRLKMTPRCGPERRNSVTWTCR